MSKENAISSFISKYQKKIPNPLYQALLLSAFTVPSAFLLKKPINRALKRAVRDPRISYTLLGASPQQAQQDIQTLQRGWFGKYGAPILLGSAIPLASLAMNIVPDAPKLGLTDWNPKVDRKQKEKDKSEEKEGLSNFGAQPLQKVAMFQDIGYQPQLDLSKSINRQQAIAMMNNNPYLAQQPSYARHLGTSIITAAPSIGNQVYLGGIYDSAVNKFQNKLSFQGIGSKVVKGVVSGALAGMFTDVVGTAIGMPERMADGLSNTIGIGQALYSILT